MVFPEFKCAQQAMAYLRHSLSAPKLCRMLDGNRQAAAAALALLDHASRMTNEREALDHIEDLIMMLRSEIFEQVAGPEEQFAARHIIGRYAMYRMGDYGEENDEWPESTVDGMTYEELRPDLEFDDLNYEDLAWELFGTCSRTRGLGGRLG